MKIGGEGGMNMMKLKETAFRRRKERETGGKGSAGHVPCSAVPEGDYGGEEKGQSVEANMELRKLLGIHNTYIRVPTKPVRVKIDPLTLSIFEKN